MRLAAAATPTQRVLRRIVICFRFAIVFPFCYDLHVLLTGTARIVAL